MAIGMRKQDNYRVLFATVVIGLAVCCAVALVGCSGDSADSTGSVDLEVADETEIQGGSAAPVVVLSPEDWEPAMPTEAQVLADRLLRKENDSLLLDPVERRQMASEMEWVLSTIRAAYPAVANISVRMSYAFGELLVGLEPQLFEAVASLLEGQPGPVTLQTGYVEFDSLNEELGLSVVVDLFPSFHAATFYFDEFLNVPAAAAAYGMVDGIEYAEANAHVGDGPDIDAVNSEGRWYVVARRAEGDCPSGCIVEELFFFVVDEADVAMIDNDAALEIAEFRELVTNLEL